jgi:hypothetical protein
MGGMCTLYFTNPQNEKSMGVMSCDLGGHGMQPPKPGMFGSGAASHLCDSGEGPQLVAK